jgi:hypothetical protein
MLWSIQPGGEYLVERRAEILDLARGHRGADPYLDEPTLAVLYAEHAPPDGPPTTKTGARRLLFFASGADAGRERPHRGTP